MSRNENVIRVPIGRVVFLLVMFMFCLLNATVFADGVRWKPKKDRRWRDDEIIKDVIVSSLKDTSEKRIELFYRGGYSAWEIMDLLFLFDSMEDESSIKTLVSLMPYYIGEHPAEDYDCILIRKGKKAIPLLQELLKSGLDECKKNLGTDGHFCRDKSLIVQNIQEITNSIKSGESCIIER